MTILGNFDLTKRPRCRSLAETLASRRFKRLRPKRKRDWFAKGYTRQTVKWVTRDLYRNGLHRRRHEQALVRLRAYMRAKRAAVAAL